MAPREPELQFTSCLLFVHSVVHPGLYVIAWSRAGIHLTSSGSRTVLRLIRVTAHVTVMSELASLVHQYFGSHHAYSSCAIPITLAFHRLMWGWDSDVIVEDQHKFFKFISLQ